jgi:hypothetical protein
MARQIVKVQMPVDLDRAASGRMYIGEGPMMLYGEGRRHQVTVSRHQDSKLWDLMEQAEDALGYVKAFVWAEWVEGAWRIDYDAGFAPYQSW